jgi:hypothetical protein
MNIAEVLYEMCFCNKLEVHLHSNKTYYEKCNINTYNNQ